MYGGVRERERPKVEEEDKGERYVPLVFTGTGSGRERGAKL
jgi:hypothetical protein